MPSHRRFTAPRRDGEVLAEPRFEVLPGLVEANRQLLNGESIEIGGLTLRDFRRGAYDEIVRLARDYMNELGEWAPSSLVLHWRDDFPPLVLAGHQPELSHPGVWIKNFAMNRLANKVHGIPLNLIVDNDTLKSASLRVPTWGSSPLSAHLQSVPFDEFTAETPYEERRVRNAELFATFPDRVAALCREWGYEPLLPRVWRTVLENPAPTIGEKFATARRFWEREWGCHNLELPVSRLASTNSFTRFVNHIAANLPRFREVYNRAVQQYREHHSIRSPSHPVPDLAVDELPFWGPPGSDGRRGRVTTASRIEPRCLRPRALTLTLFARVCLGDFFIHGIGGGKYDEVTDTIIHEFFGIEPPAYQVLTATLHLPLPTFPTRPGDVQSAERSVRDLFWNPQRHLPPDRAEVPDVRRIRDDKMTLAEHEPVPHGERVAWYQKLRQVTKQLREEVRERIPVAEQEAARLRNEAAANAVLRRRDFAWVLYPEEKLREFCRGFLKG